MPDDGNMTLTGHLKELRNRLIVCAVVFVAAVVVTLAYADRDVYKRQLVYISKTTPQLSFSTLFLLQEQHPPFSARFSSKTGRTVPAARPVQCSDFSFINQS